MHNIFLSVFLNGYILISVPNTKTCTKKISSYLDKFYATTDEAISNMFTCFLPPSQFPRSIQFSPWTSQAYGLVVPVLMLIHKSVTLCLISVELLDALKMVDSSVQ